MRRSALPLAAGLVLGLGLGLAVPAMGDDDNTYSFSDLLFARAEGTLWALQNITVSLAVDTERAAIEIAKANERIAALERRLAAVETAAKPAATAAEGDAGSD